MPNVIINITAVIGAAVIAMLVGWAWYGPLFGKAWFKLIKRSGYEPDTERVARAYSLNFVSALIMAYVMAVIAFFIQPMGVGGGLQLGFWLWLGFVATSGLSAALWAGKPWRLYLIDVGYYFVAMVLMGVLLSLWQ